MKVTPNIDVPARPQDFAAVESPPAQAFAALLTAPLSAAAMSTTQPVLAQPDERQRATVFAFQALGVFGRYGAQGAMEQSLPPGTASPASAPAGRMMPAGIRSSANGDADLPPSVQQLAVAVPGPAAMRFEETENSAPHTVHDANSSVALSHAAGPATAILSNAPLEAIVPDGSMAGNTPEADGEKAVPPQRPAPPAGAAAGNLLVAGDGGALSIVARSAEALTDIARLQRALCETAAEFGMRIGDLQVNGENQSFTAKQGGNNGGRTR